MLKDDGGGAAMRRRRQSAVYSPGGCGCGLLLLPVIAVGIGVMFVLAGLATAALVLFITAIGVTIWLYRSREQRRAKGKTNVGWIAFLVIAYLLSISYLAFFILLLASTFTGESVTVGRCTASRRLRKVRLLGVWITALAVYRSLSSQLMNSSLILPTMRCVPAR